MVAEHSRLAPVVGRTFTDCMEQLQEGYVAAVAAGAGCSMNRVNRDIYGMDVLIVRDGKFSEEEISIYLQLKNTTTIKPDTSKVHFSYQFHKREHFLRLSRRRRNLKARLVVMVTSPVQAEWSTANHESLSVIFACYWCDLEGMEVPDHVSQPTVRVPTAQLFDSNALTKMLDELEQDRENGRD
jgi:hypothetical protein